MFGSVWCRWLERGNGEVALGDVADVGGCLVVDPDGRDHQVGRVAVAFSERQGGRAVPQTALETTTGTLGIQVLFGVLQGRMA